MRSHLILYNELPCDFEYLLDLDRTIGIKDTAINITSTFVYILIVLSLSLDIYSSLVIRLTSENTRASITFTGYDLNARRSRVCLLCFVFYGQWETFNSCILVNQTVGSLFSNIPFIKCNLVYRHIKSMIKTKSSIFFCQKYFFGMA